MTPVVSADRTLRLSESTNTSETALRCSCDNHVANAVVIYVRLQSTLHETPLVNNEIVNIVVTAQSLINVTIKISVNKISIKETCSTFWKQSISF